MSHFSTKPTPVVGVVLLYGILYGTYMESFIQSLLLTVGALCVALVLVKYTFKKWMQYVNARFLNGIDWQLLEIKIPKDVLKSPMAMEIFFTSALVQTGGVGTWVDKYHSGNLVNWFSLEIMSRGGDIHFYVRTNKKFKSIIEAQIYAQYPKAEINIASDYVDRALSDMHQTEWSLFGGELILKEKDFVPIKTYVDYGMSSVSKMKEEESIDPLSSVIEFLGSLNPHEEVWIQIMVQATQSRFKKADTWFGKQDWRAEAKSELKKLKEEAQAKSKDDPAPFVTEAHKEKMRAIERNISKQGFDCGIRVMYLAPKPNFRAENIGALLGIYKQFGTQDLNGFKPTNTTAFDYPSIQDPLGTRILEKKREMLEAYALRSYFYAPYKKNPFILNTEELATLFHFPSRVTETPSLKRIDSRKSEPPINLPV